MKKILILILMITISNAELKISDFKADFKQIITKPNNKKITYYGELKLKDGIFKWNYKKPTKKEICMDGKMILIVDHDLEQVSIFNIGKKFDMLSILKKAKKYKENVYTTRIQGVLYTIQTYKGKLKYIQFKDELDNKILINFKNLKEKNIKYKKCNYPASYDVIEE